MMSGMDAAGIREAVAYLLEAARSDDGGFAPRAGLPSEPEPTALAAIALDDAGARDWLKAAQASDGSLRLAVGDVTNDSATSLAAIALESDGRARALDHLERARAAHLSSTPQVPFDPAFPGWAWTRGAFGWVEPTARATLALRTLRPRATDAIADGVGMLTDRACAGGGWNYGNRIVLGEDLPPYAQTTALGVLALQRWSDGAEWRRGLDALHRLWRQEREGSLSVAIATAALRASGDDDWMPAAAAIGDHLASGDGYFERDVVALAWAAIATGPAIDRVTVTG
jgi:hypothetical protein